MLAALPVLAPLALAVAVVVRVTSPGPVLFLQRRTAQFDRVFTIAKFRTLVHLKDKHHRPITTLNNQPFTSIGPFLRKWKLDELPQLINVLLGHMSLVGPRPKIAEHGIFIFSCRPGLTGMATLAFAEEEAILSRLSNDELDACFYNVVLPAKQQIDAEYAARATLLSDLQLLVNSVLRRWQTPTAEKLIRLAALAPQSVTNQSGALNKPLDAIPNLLADSAPVSSPGI